MRLLRSFLSFCILAAVASVWVKAADTTSAISRSDLITAEQLNSQLPAVKAGKIVLIQVGFRMMYQTGHIPDSRYGGPGSKPAGLEALQKLVAGIPHDQEIVIYCGCCPWEDCPNIRPAFRALRESGFAKVKVLEIPQSFGTDWSAKGFPVEKGN
jgi:thiosulfate/3-mercaptopyruvate sulfurtransferase